MGAGVRGEAHKARRDRRPAGAHQGAAVRAVLRVVPQGGVPPARAPRARRLRRARAPAAAPPVHLLAPPQQPHGQAAQGAQRLQRHQPAHGVPGRQRARGGLGRPQAQDGPPLRGRLLHALRTMRQMLIRSRSKQD